MVIDDDPLTSDGIPTVGSWGITDIRLSFGKAEAQALVASLPKLHSLGFAYSKMYAGVLNSACTQAAESAQEHEHLSLHVLAFSSEMPEVQVEVVRCLWWNQSRDGRKLKWVRS